MASVLECEAECEIYFQTNWSATSVNYPDIPFNYDGKSSYISVKYIPLLNTRSGGFTGGANCRITANGIYEVRCYNKTEKLALKLADDVKIFFNNVALPKDIYIGIGVDIPVIDLSTDWYEAVVQFELIQY